MLGCSENMLPCFTDELIVQRYDTLMKKNEEAGSFYIQSKIFRAKERIQDDFQSEGIPTPDLGEAGQESTQSTGQPEK